jgi:hypothetical protein
MATFPIVWISVQVHDSDYHELIGKDLKKDVERKCSDPASPYIIFNNRKQKWIDSNSVDCILHGSQKSFAKVRLLYLVIGGSLGHLRFCFRKKTNQHHVSLAKALVKTSSAS